MKRLAAFLIAALLTAALTVPAAAAEPLTLETFRENHAAVLPEGGADLSDAEKETLLAGLMEAGVTAVRDAIALGLVSSREVTAHYLERIEAYNQTYNCFITLCDDALAQAEDRDARLAAGETPGPLFGVPVVVKDNIHVAGYLTTNGLSKSSSSVSAENAVIVERLLAAGAVIVGKTNMSTEAQDARASRSAAVGETKNAYNPYLSAGGSSGGTASAVSLNFAAAGLGTDTNSSLRIPAALAGCVALRVTTGLLPRDGVVLLNSARDVPGSITRTVADQAVMLDVLTGGEYAFAENLRSDALTGLRIGVLKELTYAYSRTGERRAENLDAEVQTVFANAVEELRACGAEVVEVSMPSLFSLSEATFPTGGYKKIPKLTEAFEAFLQKNELAAVVFPTYLSTPLRSGKDAEGTYWNVYDQVFINNCRTLSPSGAVPEITVPIGQHSLGAGIGMEIAAGQNSEQLLLNIAHSYTAQYDHRVIPAGTPALRFPGAEPLDGQVSAYLQSLLHPVRVMAEELPAEARTAAAAVKFPAAQVWNAPVDLLRTVLAVLGAAAAALAAVTAGSILRQGRRNRRYGRRRGKRELIR